MPCIQAQPLANMCGGEGGYSMCTGSIWEVDSWKSLQEKPGEGKNSAEPSMCFHSFQWLCHLGSWVMKVRQLTSIDSIKSDYLARKQLLLTLPNWPLSTWSPRWKEPLIGWQRSKSGREEGGTPLPISTVLSFFKATHMPGADSCPHPEPKDNASLPITHVRNVRDLGILESTASF